MASLTEEIWERFRNHRGDSKLHFVPHWAPVALLREAGEGLSLGTMVCIAKEAARQLVD